MSTSQTAPLATATGLIDGFVVGADGSVTRLTPADRDLHTLRVGEGGYVWLHLDLDAAEAFTRETGLVDEVVADALFAAETRPKLASHGGSYLINLRGVNFNEGKQLEDMLSVRILLERQRLITIRRQRSLAIEALRNRMAAGKAPPSPQALLLAIIAGLNDRMEPVVDALSDGIDEMELASLTHEPRALSPKIAAMRHDAMVFRRYLGPQKDAVTKFAALGPDWLDHATAEDAQTEADALTRMVEELDITRDRSAVLAEQVSARRSEQMNDNMMIISVVSAIFLPLTFISGLLGMNVAGLPGTETPAAFWIVCGLCLAVGLGLALWFKRHDWF